MKRYFFLLAAMALLASCTTEVLDKAQGDSDFVSCVTMTAMDFVMDGDTRTNLDLTASGLSFTWAESDIVGIFPNAGDQVKFPMTAGAGTKSANFDGGGWALRNNYSYAAYYPFSMDNYKNSYTALPITYLGQSQSANNSTAGMGAYDYMVATASMPESGSVAFNFQHIGSVLYLQLTTPDAATFTKLTLSADEAIFTTEATVNISNGTLTPTATSKEITLDMNNISVNAGGTLNAWMLIAPVDATGKTLKATLTTSTSKTYSVDLTGKYFQTGRAYKLDGTLKTTIMQYVGCATTYDQILGNPEFAYNTVAGAWNSTNLKIFNNLSRFHLFIITTENIDRITAAVGEYDLDQIYDSSENYNETNYKIYVIRNLRNTDFEMNITTATEEVLTYYIGYATAENLTSGNVIGNQNFAINTSNNTIEITGERLYKYTGCDLGNGDLASGTFFFFCCLDTKTLTEWHEETSGLNDDHIVPFNEVQNGITLGNEHYKVYYINTLRYNNIIYKFKIN